MVGLALGLAGAVALSRSLRDLLVGVAPVDAWTYGSAALLLCLVAILAGGVPALRAIRIEPRESLSE